MANTKKYVSLDKLGLYNEKINKVISDGDAATLAAAAQAAEALGVNYDVAGAAASAKSEAIAHADSEIAKTNAAVATAQGAAEAAAAAASTADGKAVAAQGTADGAVAAIEDLADYVGEIPADEAYADIETVIGYVNKKAEETLAAANGGSSETAASVSQALETYKTENNAKVNKNTEDITALQTALDEEIARAEGKEGENAAAIKVISDDYLKAADKTELQGNINTLTGVVETLRDGIDAEKVDGVKDLIAYVEEHGTEVTGMQGDIAQNASDISGVAGRMTTAEGNITTLQGDVAKKVDQTAYDAKIAALEGADSGLDSRLQAVEAKFGDGEGNVEAQIEAAKTAAISAAAADAASKDAALKTEIETAYKQYADDEDAKIELRVDALEADTHTHGNKALLNTYTQTEANLADAVAKKHEHANAAELVKIADGDVAKWNASEGNAKTFAQGLNDTMSGRVDALETWHSNFIEVSEEEINGLFA